MAGRVRIDGRDSFSEYGVLVEDGGYKALYQVPSFKKLDSNDWQEEDGAEYDLSSPVVDVQKLKVPFVIVDTNKYYDLLDLLADRQYHQFEFEDLGLTFPRLRMSDNASMKSLRGLGKFTLTLVNDIPVTYNAEDYDYDARLGDAQGWSLDGVDLGSMGVQVLKGTWDAVLKAPNLKANLSVSVARVAGARYDEAKVWNEDTKEWEYIPARYKTKDVGLKLFIKAGDVGAFEWRWGMLFALLLRSGERTLEVESELEEFKCFYKSCNVTRFSVSPCTGEIWCEFTLTLTFTSSRPMRAREMYLATELLELVTTEDGCYVALDRD